MDNNRGETATTTRGCSNKEEMKADEWMDGQ
jgi:hypothetical protein